MKTRKHLNHQLLLSELFAQLKFPAKVSLSRPVVVLSFVCRVVAPVAAVVRLSRRRTCRYCRSSVASAHLSLLSFVCRVVAPVAAVVRRATSP